MTKAVTLTVFAALVLTAGTACAAEEEQTTEAGTATSASTSQDTNASVADPRCRPAPKALVKAFEDGLRRGYRDFSIRPAKASAVRSDDFEKVFYVSAVIEGPGRLGVGTWATNSLKVGGGLIIAANDYAREVTDWGEAAEDGSPAAEVRDMANDGATESQTCVTA
jgi:hypothetical protein